MLECIGMHFFWPEQGWRHARGMLSFELEQVSTHFSRSLVFQEPGRSAHWLLKRACDWGLVQSGLLDSVRDAASQSRSGAQAQARNLRYYLGLVYVHLEGYLMAAAFMVLVFLLRLLVLCLTLPLLAMVAFVGLVDGLVRRDIRRFGAGHESGFVYHRAKASLMPLAVLPWLLYLAPPVSLHPLLILLPGSALLGLATDIAAGSFKKYL